MTEFRTEKHAREATIGQAVAIAERVRGERREYDAAEAARVDALLAAAELVGLATNIPRSPAELLAFAKQPTRKRQCP